MRQTSDRRVSRLGAGARRPAVPSPAVPLRRDPGPLSYEGEDAIVCPECGVGLEPRPTAGKRVPGVPRHARFGWAVSVSAGRQLCRGAVPADSTPPGGLPAVSAGQAVERRLVTRAMIAARYGMTVPQVTYLIGRQPGFPHAVGRLDGGPPKKLYDGAAVLEFFRKLDERGGR